MEKDQELEEEEVIVVETRETMIVQVVVEEGPEEDSFVGHEEAKNA